MKFIFAIVYYSLLFLSRLTGLTYKEINIVVYYVLIPFVYILLIDKIFKTHLFKTTFIVFVLVFCFAVRGLRDYAEWLFDQSVFFLQGFQKIGWNYTAASAIICVVVPLILFCLLFHYAYRFELKEFIGKLNRRIF